MVIHYFHDREAGFTWRFISYHVMAEFTRRFISCHVMARFTRGFISCVMTGFTRRLLVAT